jgi:hypothetical protein
LAAVGASASAMLELGYVQVGADFPVFLHPVTRDEYALARTERKTLPGYLGFGLNVENVTLEMDLFRRDLTINAMAMAEDGTLIDPHGGQEDLRNKVLRHVGPAFAEDPVRILRILRFLARFGHSWRIAPETQELIVQMVSAGEASALVPERIWKEASRALMGPHPELFVQGLHHFGLTELPCFQAYQRINLSGPLLKEAAAQCMCLEVRAAFAFGQVSYPLGLPLGMPANVRKVVTAWAEFRASEVLHFPERNPGLTVDLLERTGAFKSQSTLQALFSCWDCLGEDTRALRGVCERVFAVNIKDIAALMPPGPAVGMAIRASREFAVTL